MIDFDNATDPPTTSLARPPARSWEVSHQFHLSSWWNIFIGPLGGCYIRQYDCGSLMGHHCVLLEPRDGRGSFRFSAHL